MARFSARPMAPSRNGTSVLTSRTASRSTFARTSFSTRSNTQITLNRTSGQTHPRNLLLDSLYGHAIIYACQGGWSPYRFSRLKHAPLPLSMHPLSLLLATLPGKHSNPHLPRTQSQLISIPSPVALTPLLSYRLQTPTP